MAMAGKSKSSVDWHKLAKTLVDDLDDDEARQLVGTLLKDPDEDEDDDEDEDEDQWEEERPDKAEAAAVAAGGPLAVQVERLGHRLYEVEAQRAPAVLQAIAAAGGGYVAQEKRSGKVEVLTDCRVPAMRGARVPL